MRSAASALALAALLLAMPRPGLAQDAEPDVQPPLQPEPGTAPAGRPALQISDAPPPGFENIDDSIETLFDVTLAGTRLGSTPARVSEGRIIFTDPEGLAALFPDRVVREQVLALVSQPLPSNESLRCLPGRTGGCGTLPAGEAGVIVSPEAFTVDFFLTGSYFSEVDTGPVYLGEPISGPSLIQTALMSISTGRGALDEVRFGATLDTLASVGRNAFVAQTLVRDQGINLQRAYAQRVWSDRRAAAGLLQDEQSLTFRSYRLVGGEFGSFFASRLDEAEGAVTPIEIVLPSPARVEIYRDDVLIQTVQLEAGLQSLPTQNFPSGSYPIRIVALDGNNVILEETRVFTRVAGLPPEGEWAFNLRAGVRALDSNFGGFGSFPARDGRFFPELTDELLAAASASRRLGDASAVSGQILVVDDAVYGEASVTTYRDNLVGLLAASVGSDSSYSLLANGSWRVSVLDVNLSARHTRVGGEFEPVPIFDDVFNPYFRSEDLVTASVGFPLAGGNLSLNGSYSRSPGLEDRYAAGARYSRSLDVGALGSARLTGFALKTNRDLRFGISISFFRRVSPKTTLFYGGGAEYRDPDPRSGLPDGIFPVAEARISHSERLGTADLVAQAGVSTDADRHRAFASADVGSNLGVADVLVEYEKRRGRGGGEDGVSMTANAFTGFTLSSGGLDVGIREFGGEAAVNVGIDRSAIPDELQDRIADVGRYTVIVGNREVADFAPGETTTLILPAYRNYAVQVQPEEAPPYSVDLTRRDVPLYPGNVVSLRYAAQYSATVFGRLIDADGLPIRNARVTAGSDTTQTDSQGYFLVTAPLNSEIRVFDGDGEACQPVVLDEALLGGTDAARRAYVRLGDLVCRRGE